MRFWNWFIWFRIRTLSGTLWMLKWTF